MTAPQTGVPASGGAAPQGGAGGGTTVVVNDGSGTSRTQQRADATQGIVDRLVTRYGTLEAALNVLAGENFEHRETIRTLNEKITGLEKSQVPNGALVLSADEKKVWDSIKAANIPIEKIVERVKLADTLEAQQREHDFGKLVDDGAAAVKFNASVLRGLLRDKGYSLELRDVLQTDGKTTAKMPYIRKANDDKAAWEPLATAAEREFKDYLPALKALPQGGGAGGTGNGTGAGATQGVATHAMPSQSSASTSQGDGGSAVDQHLARMQKRAERPNPLKPSAPSK